MAITQFSEILQNSARLNESTLANWFKTKGFDLVKFQNGKTDTFNFGVLNDIKENKGFDTYVKEDIGGSILIFEIRITGKNLECIGYVPITLFGFFPFQVSFQNKSPWFTKYRQHGFEYLMALKQFINDNNKL